MKFPACPLCRREKRIAEARKLYGRVLCGRCHFRFRGRREGAWLVDAVIAYAITAGVFDMPLRDMDRAIEAVPRVVLGGYLPACALFWILMVFKDAIRGLSPGKFLLGLRVIDTRTGNPATAIQSLKRNLVLLVPLAPLVLVWIIGRGPRPGDGWAHTRVIWKRYADNPVFSPPEAMARVFT